jgi:hypothetical protein
LKVVLAISTLCLIPTPICPAQSLGERDTDFDIGLARHVTNPVGMVAHLTTTNTYPCEGYTLRTQTRWDKDTVTVNVLGLLRPSPCYQTSAEATGTVFLGDMDRLTWYLRLQYRDGADLYRIANAQRGLSAFPIHQTFTTMKMLPAERD